MTHHDHEECERACRHAANACLDAVRRRLMLGDPEAEATHIGALLHCADVCATSAACLRHRSSLAASTCALSAEACESCALQCETLGADEVLRWCAELCRR